MAATEVPEGIIYAGKRYIAEQTLEIVDLISEGEIGGLATGVYTVGGKVGEMGWRTSDFKKYNTAAANDGNEFLRSIYWNQTPVMDDAGRFNFQRASVSYGNGSPDGNTDLKIGSIELISTKFSVSSYVRSSDGEQLSEKHFQKGAVTFSRGGGGGIEIRPSQNSLSIYTPREPSTQLFLDGGPTALSPMQQAHYNTLNTAVGSTFLSSLYWIGFHALADIAIGKSHSLTATLNAPIGTEVLFVVGLRTKFDVFLFNKNFPLEGMKIGFAHSLVVDKVNYPLAINFSSQSGAGAILIFVKGPNNALASSLSGVTLTDLKIGIYKGLNTAALIKPTDRSFTLQQALSSGAGAIGAVLYLYQFVGNYKQKVLAIEQSEALINQQTITDRLISNIERGQLSPNALAGMIDIEAVPGDLEILNLKFTDGTSFQNFDAYDSQGSFIGLKLTTGGGDDSYRLAFTSAVAKAKTDNSYGGIYRIVKSPIAVGQEFCIAIKAAGGMSNLSAGSCKIRISFRADDSNNDEIFGIDMDIKDTYPDLVLYEAFAISSRAVSSYRIYISLLEPYRYMTFNSIRVNKAPAAMSLSFDTGMDTTKEHFLSLMAAGKYKNLTTQPESFPIVMAVSDDFGVYRLLSRGIGGKSTTNISADSLECHSIVPGVLFDIKAKGSHVGTVGPAKRVTIYVPYRVALDYTVGTGQFETGGLEDHNQSAVLSLSELIIGQNANLKKTQSKNDKLLGYQTNSSGEEINPRNFYERTYSILDRNANDIYISFKVNGLSESDVNNGNLLDAKVILKITATPLYNKGGPLGRPQSEELTLRGRVSTPYIKEYKIHVGSSPERANKYFIGWEIKIVKAVNEPLLTTVRNQVFVNEISHETDYSLSYPNCALVRQTFDAQHFSEVPSRAFDTYLLKIKIPDIYDPMTRSYNVDPINGSKSYETNGSPSVLPWSGRFKGSTIDGVYVEEKVWSDNPAWCFYDLITNPRYGLGKYIDDETIDKWTLFEIAKYCDEIVENEDGTLENRFSCNVSLNSREDAHKVLDDMASIFRGMVYYYNNSIITIQDSQKNPVYSFNNSNVNDGNFIYSNSSRKVRRTVALVRYNDKNDFYKPGIEYVEDIEGIKSHGYREVDVTAFGCSSKHQARRLGKWILFTENLETETVSFRTGLEGSIVRPGDVVTIVDSNRSTSRVGGRLKKLVAGTGTSWNFHLDGLLSLTNNRYYKLIINLPDYNYDPSLGISDLKSTDYAGVRNSHILTFKFTTANMSTVDSTTVISNLDLAVSAQSRLNLGNSPQNLIWSVVSDSDPSWDLIADGSYMPEEKYRVLNVRSNADLTYDMSALEYREDKYSLVEE